MQRHHVQFVSDPRQGGAVIIVVLSLLTMLVFLGLFFYNWTRQEQTNSEFFTFRNESGATPEDIPDQDIINFGLRQVLVSTDDSLTSSALFGSRWSMSAHLIGPLTGDGEPIQKHLYSGQGILVNATGDNSFTVDYNGDATADANQTNFVLNFSPLANNGNNLLNNPTYDFNPAAGYTYPDINSLFLAIDYIDPITNLRVVKPSFALPGYFPGRRSWDETTLTSGFAGWYTSNQTINQVLRPHQDHAYTGGDRRYLDSTISAESGDLTRVLSPFPFTVSGGRMGVWDGSGEVYTMFDADLTGDGVRDSIAIDLNYPIVDIGDGREVVPIYYFKIVDMDALLNANVHGHMPQFQVQSNANAAAVGLHVYDRNTWVHYSNLGLTPAEVNPAIALHADPEDVNYVSQNDTNLRREVTLSHRGMLAQRHDGSMPVDPPMERVAHNQFTRLQMSNMELAMLLLGRPEFASLDDLSYASVDESRDWMGRFGSDGGRLRQSLNLEGTDPGVGNFPAPGNAGSDDDEDSNAFAQSRSGGMIRVDPRLNIIIPPAMHPLDFSGMGDSLSGLLNDRNVNSWTIERDGRNVAGLTLGLGERILGNGGLTNNPMRWPQYPLNGPWQNQGRINDASGNTLFRTYRDAITDASGAQALPSNALQPRSADLLANEADEVIVDLDFATDDDAIFLPSEIAAMHLSYQDWRNARMPSRLRNLAPFNFEYNRQAHRIRSQFTTESWDRMQFAYPPPGLASNARSWEYNDNFTGGQVRFPPRFGVNPSRHENNQISPNDPFRPEVRRLLTVRWGADDVDGRFPQRRLNLNKILSDDELWANGEGAFDGNGNPLFRDLVPHPKTFHDASGTPLTGNQSYLTVAIPQANLSMLPAGAPTINLIATDPYAQEWWARYDRQRLARDIYVLLYTLAAHDGTNIDGTDVTQVPVDPDVAREMAQFAVNYVDAMDRDDVITRFDYDPDLSTGWNPSETVYGVESQQLTFSEVLVISTTVREQNSPRTLHDDRDLEAGEDGHQFLYFELRNVSPFRIGLRDETWRIVRASPNPGGDGDIIDAVVKFQEPSANPSNDPKYIEPGDNFLIACHDGYVRHPNGQAVGSDFYVNVQTENDGGQLQLIVPKRDDATITVGQVDNTDNPAPQAHLDLTPGEGSDHTDYFVIDPTERDGDSAFAPNPARPSLIEKAPEGQPGPFFRLILQRRKNLDARGMGEDEWIEVDRITVNPPEFADDPFLSGVPSNAQPNLSQLQQSLETFGSRERLHPYNAALQDHPDKNGTGQYRNHSLRPQANGNHAFANDRWNQTYPGEPYWFWQPHFDRDLSSTMELLSVPLYGYRAWLDGETQLAVDFTATTEGGPVRNLVNNGIDPPSLDGYRAARQRFLIPQNGIGNGNRWFRLLNFVEVPPRSQDIIADAVTWHRRTPGRINLNTLRHEHVLAGLVDDTVHHNPLNAAPTLDLLDNDRWWIEQLLLSRDGQNSGNVRQPPGTHRANPFRPLSFIDPVNPVSSLQQSILRTNASPAVNSLWLLEARSTADVNVDAVDYHTRDRLLAKVANNTTTRSHVFAIWVGFTLHEAHTNSNGNVQIGARAVDLPTFRQFLVVDMSRLEEAYDATSETFDYRQFIIHRQKLP